MLVKLHLQDGTVYEEEIADFVLSEFIEKVNEAPHKLVQFGKIAPMGHSIKLVDTSQGGYVFDGQEG